MHILSAIQEFNLSSIVPNSNILIIGKCGSGKTTLCNNILNSGYYKDITDGIIISPTNEIYNNHNVYKYDKNIINTLMFNQKHDQFNNNTFIVFDNCFTSSYNLDDNFTNLIYTNKYHKISTIVTIQHLTVLPPHIRHNFDYYFLLKDELISNLKKIYSCYTNVFSDFNSFKNVYDLLTVNYGCMVIKNQVGIQNMSFNDIVFKFNPTCLTDLYKDIENIEYVVSEVCI